MGKGLGAGAAEDPLRLTLAEYERHAAGHLLSLSERLADGQQKTIVLQACENIALIIMTVLP